MYICVYVVPSFLSWRFGVEIYCNGCENDVWQPCGKPGLHACLCAERCTYALKKDVCGTQCKTYAQCGTHASLALACRQACPYYTEYKSGKWSGNAFVVLHLEVPQSGNASYALAVDEVLQLGRGHGFLHLVGEQEVLGLEFYDTVYLVVVRDFLARPAQFSDVHVSQRPFEAHVGDGVVLGGCGGEVRYQFLVLELVQGEVVSRIGCSVVVLHEGHHTAVHLQVHVVRPHLHLYPFLVLVLKGEALDTAPWYHVRAQVEVQCGNECGAEHIGPHQAPETHSCRQHGYYLAIVRQFHRKEYHGDEDEQSREQVGVEGDEVGIICEDDTFPRSIVGGELVHIVVEVEHHGNADDKDDAEDVCPQKILYYVLVQSGE